MDSVVALHDESEFFFDALRRQIDWEEEGIKSTKSEGMHWTHLLASLLVAVIGLFELSFLCMDLDTCLDEKALPVD